MNAPDRSDAVSDETAAAANWIERLAALRVTLVALVLLALGAIVAYNAEGEGRATLPLVLPLSVLAMNLLAAVASNRAFRRQTALLVFHLALLAIVVLVALGRLTYLRGATEVVTGTEFSTLIHQDAGPWHWNRLDRVRFTNDGFAIRYQPGLQRERTVNRVRWIDEDGQRKIAEVGDIEPLVIGGYRFYTTHNKGFALMFRWQPQPGGEAAVGSVNLPAYPAREHEQAREWRLPGIDAPIWTLLDFDEVLLDPESDAEFRLPQRHQVVVRIGDRRWTVAPGGRIALENGTLTYEELRTWMGYAVFYDWTIPWLLTACLVAVLALAWHFRSKYFAQPWAAGN
ncbi:MAG: cytochrome c biogenesis protein ResB [Rhodocyclaceae bacterium]|nr:cytochrome c biogenesis protein ResB [Rhodocyclaceae bacterium]